MRERERKVFLYMFLHQVDIYMGKKYVYFYFIESTNITFIMTADLILRSKTMKPLKIKPKRTRLLPQKRGKNS